MSKTNLILKLRHFYNWKLASPISFKSKLFFSSQYDNFFNWTITYRRDADFRNQYGIIKKIKETPIEGSELNSLIYQFGLRNTDIGQNKTKKIAWFVSHCETKSEREKYVEQLQKYIQVKIVKILSINNKTKCIFFQTGHR